MAATGVALLIGVMILFGEPTDDGAPLSLKGGESDAKGTNYELVWSDEFEVDGKPDPSKWDFEEGFLRNRELQWYQASNARCVGGNLVIQARQERVENPIFRSDSGDWRASRRYAEYTSASLITKPHLAWTYGRVEVRARIPIDKGAWPAIWTTGLGRWPDAGEIDIMEYYEGMLLANFVHADEDGRDKWKDSKHPLIKFAGRNWEKDFHVWVMEWSTDEIRLYVDEMLLNSFTVRDAASAKVPGFNPFEKPHRLRLNLAIGANGGDPSAAAFPLRYEIDYVRVYQLKE